jgi:hypothetical protein
MFHSRSVCAVSAKPGHHCYQGGYSAPTSLHQKALYKTIALSGIGSSLVERKHEIVQNLIVDSSVGSFLL